MALLTAQSAATARQALVREPGASFRAQGPFYCKPLHLALRLRKMLRLCK
jgi:hypothetical protein